MFVKIDRSSALPLQTQIYAQLRQMIDSQQVRSGMRVTTTRILAERLGISRMTVLLAYEQLIAEGYLQTRPGIGTFVSADPPIEAWQEAIDIPDLMPHRELPRGKSLPPVISFDPHHLGGDLIPFDDLRRQVTAAFDDMKRHDQLPASGLGELRANLAEHLGRTHGIALSAEEVVLFASRQQAYEIVARLLGRASARAVVEAPGVEDALRIFANHFAEVLPIRVDEGGLSVESLPSGSVALAHVTPTHQHHIGATLSLARRERLLDWARRSGACILEDDCDSGVRHNGASAPLFAMQSGVPVVHIGGFALTLGHATSLTYMLAPRRLVAPVLDLKEKTQKSGTLLEQALLARFLASGGYARHLRRLRKNLAARRDMLIRTLRQHFGQISLLGIDAPTHIAWVIPSGLPAARAIRERAHGHGIKLRVPDALGMDAKSHGLFERILLLGYAAIPESLISQGVARLVSAIL